MSKFLKKLISTPGLEFGLSLGQEIRTKIAIFLFLHTGNVTAAFALNKMWNIHPHMFHFLFAFFRVKIRASVRFSRTVV